MPAARTARCRGACGRSDWVQNVRWCACFSLLIAFLLGFRCRKFVIHGTQQLLQEGGIVGFRHPQHGFCAVVRKFIRRIRKAAYRSFDRLDQQAVIVNSTDDSAVVIEYVLPIMGRCVTPSSPDRRSNISARNSFVVAIIVLFSRVSPSHSLFDTSIHRQRDSFCVFYGTGGTCKTGF